jgi:hypothetical protein
MSENRGMPFSRAIALAALKVIAGLLTVSAALLLVFIIAQFLRNDADARPAAAAAAALAALALAALLAWIARKIEKLG